MPPQTSAPVVANFSSSKLTIGAGVAIFHLASERVVVCYHTRDKYWFLPKGRRNANEGTGAAAEREGFEESGYRNRLLPLPMQHRQPDPDEGHQEFVKEPLWTQLVPLSRSSQYMLFWYVAETVPRDVEEAYTASAEEGEAGRKRVYQAPPTYPIGLTLRARISEDVVSLSDGTANTYEPVRHEGTGVDEEELLYQSQLLPINDACRVLRGSIMEDVVRRGWDAIQSRIQMEAKDK